MFPCEVREIFKNTFFLQNTSRGCFCTSDGCFYIFLKIAIAIKQLFRNFAVTY